MKHEGINTGSCFMFSCFQPRNPMSTDSTPNERSIYLEGIRLCNEHEFFEAHETWEDCWNMAYGLKHEFYQGMIQCAV